MNETTPFTTLDQPNSISILHGQEALETFEKDLAAPIDILAWAYLIDPPWFTSCLKTPLTFGHVQLIVDHRQRRTVAQLCRQHKNLHARSWSWNRTLHDKTLMIPSKGIIWLGTHNWTRGSWTLSTNRAARLVSRQATDSLLKLWMEDYKKSRPILPKKM